MPDYGIDWSKVDARRDTRIAALAPADKADLATEAKARSTRKRSTPVKEPAAVTAAVSAKVVGTKAEAEDPNEGIDTEPEDENGEKA